MTLEAPSKHQNSCLRYSCSIFDTNCSYCVAFAICWQPKNPSNASDAYTEDKILERIAPIGSIRTEPFLADSSANEKVGNITKIALSGEEVYVNRCAACHEAGVLNAPKIGDTAAWAPRISQGLDTLLYSVLNGNGAMASQKGPLNTDEELKSAVIYLTNKSGGSL